MRLPPAPVLAALAAAAAYAPTLGNGFARDDEWLIARNPLVQDLAYLPTLATSHYWAGIDRDGNLWRPLPLATVSLEWVVGQGSPAVHHLGNLLLHAAASALAALLLRSFGLGPAGALAGGLLFALHPARADAVCEAVQRSEILAFCGIAGALLLEARARERPERRGPLLLGMAGALAGGLLAKESAILFLLPLLPAVHAFGPGPRPRGGAAWVAPYAVAAAVAAAYLVVRFAVLRGLGTGFEISLLDNPAAAAPLAVRLATACDALGRYAVLAAWPATLSADRGYSETVPLGSFLAAGPLAGLLVLAVLAAALGAARRAPRGALAAAWATALLPFGNFLFPVGFVVAERILYTPLLGVSLAAGIALDRAVTAGRPALARGALGAAAVLLAAAGVRTGLRALDWRTEERLYESAARVCPRSARAQCAVGDARLGAGDVAGARARYETALGIWPDYSQAANNLGRCLQLQGDREGAGRLYRRAVETGPGNGQAAKNLGAFLAEGAHEAEAGGRREEAARLRAEALPHLRRATELRPADPLAWGNLGETLLEARDAAGAAAAFAEAARRSPGDPRWPERLAEARRRLPR